MAGRSIQMHPFLDILRGGLPSDDWRSVTALVAVSGGADSVALLRGLAALRLSSDVGRLIVAHVQHGLRGAEAEADAEFVRRLAHEMKLECVVGELSGTELRERGDSLEDAAREARYLFFEQAANSHGARYLFTAHTADDQAETILHRIVRGTGIDGLAGIPPTRPLSPLTTIVRPLLAARRMEVLSYLSSLRQVFRDDASNADHRFTRNRLRHDLLPRLAADYNPQIVEALLRLGEMAADASTILDDYLAEAIDDVLLTQQPHELVLDAARLRRHSSYAVRSIFVRLWRRQRWPLQAMSFDKWHALAALAAAPAPASLTLPGNILAVREGDALTMRRASD